MLLWNKTAIITGASRGLGRQIAKSFVKEGVNVVLVSRSEDEINDLVTELNINGERALAACADIRVSENVKMVVAETVKNFGHIDILINNAGTNYISSIALSDETKWQEVINTNLIGTYICCKHVIRQMLKQHKGRIVNIASISAHKGVPFCSAYSASKAGILGLTRSFAVELGKEDISVNAVCPGAIEGYLSEHARGEWTRIYGVSPKQFQQKLKETIPRKRFIKIKDVIQLITFLSSDSIKDITGQAINVDGGGGIS